MTRPTKDGPGIAGVPAALFQAAAQYLDLVASRAAGRAPRTLPILYMDVTRECNLRCSYCGFTSGYPVKGPAMDTSEIAGLLDQAARLGTRIVSFGGGEPFTRSDMVVLMRRAARMGLLVHVNTNGTLFDHALAEDLGRIPGCHVCLSLDHHDPKKNDASRGEGSHAGVVRALGLLRTYAPGVLVTLQAVVGSHNVHALGGVVDFAVHHGAHGLKFVPVHDNLAHKFRPEGGRSMSVSADERGAAARAMTDAWRRARSMGISTSSWMFARMAARHLEGTPSYPCHAGFAFLNVDPYGIASPCYGFSGGVDARAVGLEAAWRHPAMDRLRTEVKRCRAGCVSPGMAEPSLVMDPRNVVSHPVEVARSLGANVLFPRSGPGMLLRRVLR